jgi:DNA-binding winged helix-turn-helix (wHTH) protein/Tol biopolymer transport system component
MQTVDREYQFGPFQFRTPDGVLFRGSEPIPLTPKAADLLSVLLENPGRVLSKDDLIKQVWPDAFVTDGNLAFQVHLIRQALGETTEQPTYIATVPRRGYRFIAAVTQVPSTERPGHAVPPPVTEMLPAPIQSPATASISNERPGLFTARRVVLTLTGASILMLGAASGLTMLGSRPVPRIRNVSPLTSDGGIKLAPMVTDGSRLYMPTTVQARAAWIPLHGGDVTLIAALKDLTLADVSITRSEFLALSRHEGGHPHEVWAIPTLGHTTRRVGDLKCNSASWSPDGEHIACAAANILSIARADGEIVRKLVSAPAQLEDPRWSPDGRRVRFTQRVFPKELTITSLWEVRTDGTNLHRLLPEWNAEGECCGKWFPDGSLYVFEAKKDDRSDLWVLEESPGLFGRSEERQPIRLTSGPASFSQPLPSSDGKAIFAQRRSNRGELVRYDTTVRQFVPYLGGISAAWVTFSRDRKRVAYISFPENSLWVARADGAEPRQLTLPPFEVAGVAWSPDAKRLAIRAGPPGKRKKIYLISSDGGAPEPIAAGDVDQGIPGWSPDGTRLVFGDVPEKFGVPTGLEVLHVYDIVKKTTYTLPGSEGLWTSRWSPDGRYISALTISIKEQQTLRLFDWETGTWRILGANHVNNPTWSSDSRYIYYDTEGGTRALRRIRLADGHVEQFTDLETYPVAHYGWSGIALDGSPIVLGERFDTQIYALELERR